jgi:biopolymer transport protein ExbD
MAGSAQDAGEDAIVGINVTPLVDITLVLLIILMVTAPMLEKQQRALDTDLPKVSGSTSTLDKQVLITVELAENGELAIDKEKFGKDMDGEVLKHAKAAHDANPDLRAVINADAKVQHGRIMNIISLLKQAGVQKIAFGVMAISTAPPAPSK